MSLDISAVDQAIYLAQIVLLLWCAFMVWRARKAMNGLGRGMLLLFALLIVRRVDDAFAILNDTGTLILSSLVVVVVALDVYQIYKMRELSAFYYGNRQARMKELNRMYQEDEENRAKGLTSKANELRISREISRLESEEKDKMNRVWGP